MATIGPFVFDPNARSSCLITLENGERIIVTHDEPRLTIETERGGPGLDTVFGCDLDSPEGRAAYFTLTRNTHPETMAATPLGAFVRFVKDCATAADVRARCTALLSGQ